MMKRHHRVVSFTASLTKASAALAAALALSPALAGGSEPFRMALAFTETVGPSTSPEVCPVLMGKLSGIGLAREIGQVRGTSTDCIFPQADGSFQFQSVNATFIVPDGAKITMSYGGTFTPKLPGLYSLSGTFSITGGTGKYSKATGTGTLTGTEVVEPTGAGQGVVQFVGTWQH